MWSTRMSLVMVSWWLEFMCVAGPPFCRCMVRRRDKVVVDIPMYVLLRGAQSSLGHLNSVHGICPFELVGSWGVFRFAVFGDL